MVKGGIICGDDFLSAHAGRKDLNGGVREKCPHFKHVDNLWWVTII